MLIRGPIDAGRCNKQFFIGEVAKALKGEKKLSGKTSFLLTILKKIFSYRSKHYRVKTEAKKLEGKKLLMDISNGQRAGGEFHNAPVVKATLLTSHSKPQTPGSGIYQPFYLS